MLLNNRLKMNLKKINRNVDDKIRIKNIIELNLF